MSTEKCNCDICTHGIAFVEEKEKGFLETVGWYAHLVVDDDSSPTGYNCHTHGLPHTLEHLDFQIVCPLPSEMAHNILFTIIGLLKEDKLHIVENEKVEGIISNHKIKFVLAEENNRQVWRVVFPDKCGSFQNQPWAQQFIGTKFEEQYNLPDADKN